MLRTVFKENNEFRESLCLSVPDGGVIISLNIIQGLPGLDVWWLFPFKAVIFLTHPQEIKRHVYSQTGLKSHITKLILQHCKNSMQN